MLPIVRAIPRYGSRCSEAFVAIKKLNRRDTRYQRIPRGYTGLRGFDVDERLLFSDTRRSARRVTILWNVHTQCVSIASDYAKLWLGSVVLHTRMG